MGDKKKEEHEGHKNYYCFEMKLNEWISFFFLTNSNDSSTQMYCKWKATISMTIAFR